MPLFRKCKCDELCTDRCTCRCHGFIRRNRLVRKAAFLGGILVGVYFLGASQGWWDRFLF